MSKIKFYKQKKNNFQHQEIQSIDRTNLDKANQELLEAAKQINIQNHLARSKAKNIVVFNQTKDNDYKLYLVIGEEVSTDTKEFSSINLYIKDEFGIPKLYANINLPYQINHSKFLDIEDDPRYIFYENYNPNSESYSYACMLKPFGDLKGVYRIMDVNLIKIRDIDPLMSEEKTKKLIKKR